MIITKTKTTLKEVRQQKAIGNGREGVLVPHGTLIDTLVNDAEERGWDLDKPVYALHNGGATLAAAWAVTGAAPMPPGYQLGLGVAASNDWQTRMRRPRLYIGWVGPHGPVVYGMLVDPQERGHGYSTTAAVHALLGRYAALANRAGPTLATVAMAPMGPGAAARLLYMAARRECLAWSRIGVADVAWQQRQETSAEILLAAFAAANAKAAPVHQMANAARFFGMVDMALEAKKTA